MYRIGIDLGGTNIAAGIINEEYKIIGSASLPTNAPRPAEEIAADIVKAASMAADKAGISLKDCDFMGVGSPGTCDTNQGVVRNAFNLGWKEVQLGAILSRLSGLTVKVTNDANAAALAEVKAGAARGFSNALMVTLGTGIGGGIIIDGKIYGGHNYVGGEIGHKTLVYDGEPCSCGQKGCYEAYGSMTALIRQAEKAASEHPESALSKLKVIDGRSIFDAADGGDSVAQSVVNRWIRYVSAGIVSLSNLLAPEIVIVGGGVSARGEALMEPIRSYVNANIFGGANGFPPIVKAAQLGNDAGIIGAALL